MMFVLHFFENHLTTANLHNWPIISHTSLRHLSSRQAFTAAVARPWGEIPSLEVAEVFIFLISRFPRPPSIAIGEREIGLLAKALLASKVPYQHIFAWGKRICHLRRGRTHLGISCTSFPMQVLHGVPISGTFVGMEQPLKASTAGRVFRSNAGVVGTPPGEDCFSFYGKATQWSNWIPHLTEFLSKIHNSTQNCSGVVVGGFLGCNHQKSKRAETTHESRLCKYHCLVHSPSSDKRWAIREAGARIARIWALSSTHWAGNPSMPSSSSLFLPAPPLLAVTNDDDWGSKWPSPPS